MKPLTTGIAVMAFICMLFAGCTTVPVSYNKTLPTKDLVGYWQRSDNNAVFEIQQYSDGSAKAREFMYKKSTMKWEYTKSGNCYFTSIKKKGKTYQLMSVGEGSQYRSFLYKFEKKKRLILEELSYDFIAEETKKNKDFTQGFSSPESLVEFITQHIKNDKLFDKGETYIKRTAVYPPSKPELFY